MPRIVTVPLSLEETDQYDYSFQRGKNGINQYFSKTFKGTDKIIENNKDFFKTQYWNIRSESGYQNYDLNGWRSDLRIWFFHQVI